MRFWAGRFNEEYLHFDIKVSCSDFKGKKYRYDYQWNFAYLLGITISQSNEYKAQQQQQELINSIKKQTQELKTYREIFQKGISIRNNDLVNYNEAQMKQIIKNLIDTNGENQGEDFGSTHSSMISNNLLRPCAIKFCQRNTCQNKIEIY